MSKEIVVNPENIKHWREIYSTKSDEDLIAISEGCHPTYATAVTAKILLSERREKFNNEKHTELLAEIKKPHWSMAPGFIVGFVAMVASVFAAYYSYLAYSQPSQPSAVNQQSQNAPSTLQKPLPLSQPQSQQSSKR